MIKKEHVQTLFEVDPSAIISLYQIDLKEKGKYLFHAGENGYKNKIIFDSLAYDFFPIQAEGFEIKGDGRLPRPKLVLSNHGGVISMRLNYFKDFINYKVTRIKTFVKYLDNANFPNNLNPHSEPDPEAAFEQDVFFINQKTKEDDSIVEFELVSLLELQNANIPNRTVYSNHCSWQYRGDIGCGYKGKPIADEKNVRFVPSGYNGAMVGEEVYFGSEFNSEEFAPLNSNQSYNDWDINITYNKGDVVKTVPFDYDSSLNPIAIYVCIQDGVKSNPIFDKESWRLDECDRTLCGCRLRFADSATGAGGGMRTSTNANSQDAFWTESEEGLPFGGFPGVDPYDFK